MELLLCILVGYLAYHFWLRNILFYSQPKFTTFYDRKILRSPANGTVVYCDVVNKISDRKMVKRGREISCPYEYLDRDTEYLHIGIFMSPYNNHHLVTMNKHLTLLDHSHIKGDYNEMWDSSDNFLGKWWKGWFEKKLDKWLEYNARDAFLFSNNIVVCIIFDKWVNKISLRDISNNFEAREILGFVHRGSQTDIFIPSNLVSRKFVESGMTVSFDDKLVELKNEI